MSCEYEYDGNNSGPPTWFLVVCLLAYLFVLGLAFHCRTSRGDELLPKCQAALSECDRAVETLKTQVLVLKDSEKAWKREAKAPRDGAPTLLLSTVSGAIGGALGGAVADSRSGAAPGGIVGLLTGFVLGLVIGR